MVVAGEAMAATKDHHHVKVEMEATVEAVMEAAEDHLDQAAATVVSVAKAVDHDKVRVA